MVGGPLFDMGRKPMMLPSGNLITCPTCPSGVMSCPPLPLVSRSNSSRASCSPPGRMRTPEFFPASPTFWPPGLSTSVGVSPSLGGGTGIAPCRAVDAEQALRARPRRRGLLSDKGTRHEAADNVLDRQFEAKAPNQKWIADFTYLWTAEGWLYVAAVIDLFSRRVVGRSMSATMAAQLVADALMMAIWRRGTPDALLHHSDQGSQYSSEQFQKLLADHGVTCSMSRSGNVWDNAAMESFFSSLKPREQPARCIAPATRPGPTCSTTSSGSTTRVDATRPSAISALWSSSGSRRQLKLRVSTRPAAAHTGSIRIGMAGRGQPNKRCPILLSPDCKAALVLRTRNSIADRHLHDGKCMIGPARSYLLSSCNCREPLRWNT